MEMSTDPKVTQLWESNADQPLQLHVPLYAVRVAICIILSVREMCIVAKRYVLQQMYVNKWIGSAPGT